MLKEWVIKLKEGRKMKKFLSKLWHKFRAKMDWECPKCGGELLETYGGPMGGKRCIKCSYWFKYEI